MNTVAHQLALRLLLDEEDEYVGPELHLQSVEAAVALSYLGRGHPLSLPSRSMLADLPVMLFGRVQADSALRSAAAILGLQAP